MGGLILVVDDSEENRRLFRYALAREFTVFTAATQADGLRIFEGHLERLAGIVVAACVPGRDPNTQELIIDFRRSYPGPIVVVGSSDYEHLFQPLGINSYCQKTYSTTRLRQAIRFHRERIKRGQSN